MIWLLIYGLISIVVIFWSMTYNWPTDMWFRETGTDLWHRIPMQIHGSFPLKYIKTDKGRAYLYDSDCDVYVMGLPTSINGLTVDKWSYYDKNRYNH